MELPSADQQTTLYGLLGFIGTALMAIARGLYKLYAIRIEQAKQEGKVLAKLEIMELDLKELKTDIDAIALFVGTPRAIATKKVVDQQKVGSDD